MVYIYENNKKHHNLFTSDMLKIYGSHYGSNISALHKTIQFNYLTATYWPKLSFHPVVGNKKIWYNLWELSFTHIILLVQNLLSIVPKKIFVVYVPMVHSKWFIMSIHFVLDENSEILFQTSTTINIFISIIILLIWLIFIVLVFIGWIIKKLLFNLCLRLMSLTV